jgi:hypothetical protein
LGTSCRNFVDELAALDEVVWSQGLDSDLLPSSEGRSLSGRFETWFQIRSNEPIICLLHEEGEMSSTRRRTEKVPEKVGISEARADEKACT